jgi:hypothetical protein
MDKETLTKLLVEKIYSSRHVAYVEPHTRVGLELEVVHEYLSPLIMEVLIENEDSGKGETLGVC